jgi:hypothetical protein
MSGLAKTLLGGALIFGVLSQVNAQVTTAAIHGSVTDSTGAVISNARVTAMNTATGIATKTTTNNSGYYFFPVLQIGGPYTVDIEAAGFQKFEANSLILNLNANREVDAKLMIGATSQSIEINASAIQVETSNTQLEQIVTADQIEYLPLFGRDAAGLQKLMPGTVESSDRFGPFSVNGSQTSSNSFLLNGADNNYGPLEDEDIIVNPDALQEENIETSTINPEFSRNGGSVVNQVFKAGTNTIHGSAFEYYRDTFMNNGGYFALPGSGHPPFHQNLYGMTLGGPIVKDRLFLFVAYQGFRRRTGGPAQSPVFTGATRGGTFSGDYNIANGGTNSRVGLSGNPIPFNIGTCVADPNAPTPETWADCFPTGNVVLPTTSFNSIASALMSKYIPPGNSGSTAAPLYAYNSPVNTAEDQGIIRLDAHLSDMDSLLGSFIFQSSPTTASSGASLPGFNEVNAQHFKIAAGSWEHTFNQNSINELRTSYFRFNFPAETPAQIITPSSAGFGINPQNPASSLPAIALTGLFTFGFTPFGPQPTISTNFIGADIFSRTAGNHNLKFGFTMEQFFVAEQFSAENNGEFGYSGGGEYSSGDPALDFLLGIPDSYTQTSGGTIDTKAWEYYAFAQDNWKVSKDFTLNYGIAWDTETPNQNDQFGGLGISCFYISSTTSTVFPGGFPGLLYPGDPGCNKAGGATTKFDHFSPRFGFAWSPSYGPSKIIGAGAHEFAVRGGFGVYYNRDQQEGQGQNIFDPPFLKSSSGALDFGGSPSFANPFADVAGNGSEPNPFPFTRPKAGASIDWANYTGEEISVIDPNYNVPYIYNFNLNIQRELPASMVLQIGYVGSYGHRLATTFESDPITPAGHAACLANVHCIGARYYQHYYFPQNTAQPAATGGYADYWSVGTLATRGTSNYNSFQASLIKSTSHGLYLTLAYTYSHGLDNASGYESSGGSSNFDAMSINNIPGFQYLSYGDSDYDARHRFVASYNYEVPLLASLKSNLVLRETLGGWHIAGVTALQTGFPVTITNAGTYNSLWCDALSYYHCPDNTNTSTFHIQSLNPRAYGYNGSPWFNRSDFSQEPIGTFGNVKRNFFHGPGFNYTNLSIYKLFPLGANTERSLQLALQASNVFNHANFANPDSNFTDGPYFGQITGVKSSADYNGDPSPGRLAELVAKFRF